MGLMNINAASRPVALFPRRNSAAIDGHMIEAGCIDRAPSSGATDTIP